MSSQTYDTIAERYRDSKWLLFRHFIERYTVMTLLGDLHDRTVLDMACGEGMTGRDRPRQIRSPACLLLLHHAPRSLGKRGHSLDAALVGQGVSARAGQFAVCERQLAGRGERDERSGAESKLAASSADDEPLDPAAGTGRLDEAGMERGSRSFPDQTGIHRMAINYF